MSTSDSANAPTRARLKLLTLGVLCIAPIVASYTLYFFFRPGAARNYGELITPVPVPEIVSERTPAYASLKGKWVLLMADGGACGELCKAHLWQIRQLRLTQGKEMDRLMRAWLVDDDVTPDQGVLRDYEGTVVLRKKDAAGLYERVGAETSRNHIFVIDPLGNLMMKFPANPDLNRVKRDISHLLKVSRIG